MSGSDMFAMSRMISRTIMTIYSFGRAPLG
jgi:hypothetical protein